MNNKKEIIALSDFEHVLLRPTMYIGNIETSEERVPIIKNQKVFFEYKEISVGFYKLMIEILDNAFDEAKRQNGKMKKIEIYFDSKTNKIKIIDTGGGFINASRINRKTKISNVASAMTYLRAGSNFKNDNVDENLIGTNGVGASIVNMLSDYFSIKTTNTKEVYFQEWTKFVSNKPKVRTKKAKDQTGTVIEFIPRKDIFKKYTWDKEYIHSLMVFKQFVKKHDSVISNLEFNCFFDDEKLDLDINFIPEESFQIKNKIGTLIVWESFSLAASLSFVNGAMCSGIHQRMIMEYLNDTFQSPNAHRFYEVLILLNLPPKLVKFGDQNKTKFDSSRKVLSPILDKHFLPHIKRGLKKSSIYDIIIKRITELEQEVDVRNLRNKKNKQKKKISDKYFSTSGKAENLFIVEGDSAKGPLLQRRDPKRDGVYTLKGKVKNARRLSDLTSNNEIIDLMNILNLDPENDKNSKYKKIIIATDADPDGLGHIASLVTNLFWKWFPNVIRQGKLYILYTPLITADIGKKTRYFYNFKEFDKFTQTKKVTNIRYLKGLGSLSKDDWEYVFCNMRLLRLAEDSKTDKLMEMAFGSNAALRKIWLRS